MGTSGSFKIVRTTASYFFSPSGHGKWSKTVFFRIFANYSNAKIFKRYPRVPNESWHPGVSENVVLCYSIIFLTRVMAAPKGHFALALWLVDLSCFFSQCYINRCTRNWGVWAKQAEWWQWSEVGNIARRNGGGCSSYSVWSAVVGTVGIVGKGTVGVVTV